MNCTSVVRDSRCNNHGYFCSPLDICECDSSWTALGDYWIHEGGTCDINKNTIRGLAATEAAVACVYLIIILYHIPKKYAEMRMNFLKFLRDPRMLCIFFCILIGISDLLIALSSLTQKQPEIFGKDIMSSVFATVHSFLCFLVLSAYFQIIVNFLESSDPLRTADSKTKFKIIGRLALLRNFSWCVVLFSIPITLSAALSKVYPLHAREFAMTFIIGIGVLVFLYGLFFLAALKFMVAELTSHLEKYSFLETSNEVDNLPTVCRRLKTAYYLGGTILIAGSTIMILFGSLDILLRKYAYLGVAIRLISLIAFTILFISISGAPSPTSPARRGLAVVRRLSTDAALFFPFKLRTKIHPMNISAASDEKESKDIDSLG